SRVLGRYESAGAARAIWGQEAPEAPARELLFFLSEPVPLSVSWRELKDYLQAPGASFERVDPAIIDRIEADYGSVERFVRRRLLNTSAGGPVLDMSGMIRLPERDFERLRSLEPSDSKQARQAVVDTIIRRRGPPQFRHALLEAYDYRCAITNCNAVEALEAATILPFRGRETHHPANGLLLRADVHTLFD